MTNPVVPRLDFGEDVPSSYNENNFDVDNDSKRNTFGLRVSAEQRRLHYLYQEYAAVAKDPIEGIYVTPSVKNCLEWLGVLIVRAGIYCGGMFRFTLTIPSDFPDTTTMPVVRFEDNIFHPLIQPKTNVTDLSRYFPSGWQRDRNHIYQVLAAVQGMFFRCRTSEPARAVNPEAALLIRDELHKFKQLAREAVRQSRTQIYGAPNSDYQNAINFMPWDVELEPFRQYLLQKISANELLVKSPKLAPLLAANTRKKKRGFSWIDAEHCQYMCDLFQPVLSESATVTNSITVAGGTDSPLSPDLNTAFAATEIH